MFMSSLVTTFLYTTFLACDNISLGAGRHRQNSFSCRKTKVMKDEGHIITDARSVSSKLIRRKILSAFALSLCTIVNKACANDEQILIECKNGSVASESAVPGAYQQQCFDLLQRTFILEVRFTNCYHYYITICGSARQLKSQCILSKRVQTITIIVNE